MQQEQIPHKRDKKVASPIMANAKTSVYKSKEATNKSSQCSTMANAEIANCNVFRDGEAPKENPSSSAHPVSITHKVRLPTFIPLVLALVRLDKEEKALESCTVSHKRTTSSHK